MSNKVNANVKANLEVVKAMFDYVRTDNGHKCVAVVLGDKIRFKKEDKSIKAEDSVGFKAVCADIREYADGFDIKAYYTSAIITYERDKNGEFVRDEYGDRVRHSQGGWLFEMKKDIPYNHTALEKMAVKFAEMVTKGIANGDYVVEEKKPKSPTKAQLEDKIAALERQIAALTAAKK